MDKMQNAGNISSTLNNMRKRNTGDLGGVDKQRVPKTQEARASVNYGDAA